MTLVSVIIPTRGGRDELLERAIASTRPVGADIAIEVIVVANGKNVNHQHLCSKLRRHCSSLNIKVVDAGPDANVGSARNIGLDECSGDIVRFLDDDDYLVPEIAHRQYVELWRSDADLSTYAGRIEDASGKTHQLVIPEASADYGCAVLGARCPALTFATIYRTPLVRPLRWSTAWRHTEDEDWMRRILQAGDPRWIRANEVVGVWYQHDRQRLSKPYPVLSYYRNRATSILQTVAVLDAGNRLTQARKTAAAAGLWSAIHGGFYFSPVFWSRVAREAMRLDSYSRPEDPVFSILPRGFPPVVLEWLVLPKRWLNHGLRLLKGLPLGRNNVRKLP